MDMWSISLNRPFGGSSARRITLFVSAMLVALFTTLATATTFVQAQEARELMATWSGDNLEYYNTSFARASSPASEDPSVPNLQGTPCAAREHVYRTNPQQPRDAANRNHLVIVVICLDDSYDGDKSQAIGATMLTYTAPADATSARDFVLDEGIGAQNMEVAPEGVTGPVTRAPNDTDSATDTNSTSTCTGEGTIGIGWIVCPLTNWLAKGMDGLFGILESFLTVAPISTDRGSAHYYMWGVMQNFANILFIIAFLIIIYSQITNLGLSNYGLKRLLPRLIIAAVLVNISYWIAAVAVDISNILGSSLHDLFSEIGNRIPDSAKADTNIRIDQVSWSAVSGSILSAGAVTFTAASIIGGAVTSAGASLWFLLVALATAMVSVLVAILVMAVRQALITILVIISPLAFVAYLLPSTEKYFDRWKDLFITMLLVFPIISVVFGGSQLAGLAIIYSASPDNTHYFNLIILGMLVQIAPVIITPLLIKLSGSLIGRIAGIVNDPNKGIIDRTRKFAQNRHDMTKYQQISNRDRNGNLRRNPLALAARWNAAREENNSNKLKAWQGGVHAIAEESKGAHEAARQNRLNEMVKSAGEDEGKKHIEHDIAHSAALRQMYYRQRTSHDEAEVASKQTSTMYEGLKADPAKIAKDALEREIGDKARKADEDIRSVTSREAAAKHLQEREYNKRLIDSTNTELREFAGFNEIDPHGVARVVNIAQETEAKNYETLVEASKRALQREEATLEEQLEIIRNGTSSNPLFAHFKDDTESRSAALRLFMATAPMKMRQELAAELDISLNAKLGTQKGILRSELAGALKQSGAKPFYISQTRLNQITEGTLDPVFSGVPGKAEMIRETLNAKGLGTQLMVQVDRDDLQAVRDYLRKYGIGSLNADAQEELKKNLKTAFADDRFRSQMDKRTIELSQIWDDLGMGPRS